MKRRKIFGDYTNTLNTSDNTQRPNISILVNHSDELDSIIFDYWASIDQESTLKALRHISSPLFLFILILLQFEYLYQRDCITICILDL